MLYRQLLENAAFGRLRREIEDIIKAANQLRILMRMNANIYSPTCLSRIKL
jgi:hypothetical protein